MAGADRKHTYKPWPGRHNRKTLPVDTLKDPESGDMGGFPPQTQFVGATAAVLHYKTVSRLVASVAARWIKIPRLGYSDGFCLVTAESAAQEALRAFIALSYILCFELKDTKSERGSRTELRGATSFFVVVGSKYEAQL